MSKDKKFMFKVGEGLRSVRIQPKFRCCNTKWIKVCFGF